MPLDAICLSAVVEETAPQVEGARIEKVQQPGRDQVVLQLRRGRKLLLCAGADPRIHLTERSRDNPSQPPMFCMLLRKYLQGGVIRALRQAPLERVVMLEVDGSDELGERRMCTLILELPGRRANLILCDGEGRVIDCLRRIELGASDRAVLPGLFYRMPAPVNKLSPLDTGEECFAAQLAACAPGTPLERWLVDTFTALSPLVARELVYRAFGDSAAAAGPDREALWGSFSAWQADVKGKRFTPHVVKNGAAQADFSYLPVLQYGAYAASVPAAGFGALLDDFFESREQADRVRQQGRELLKTVSSARDRLRRRLAVQQQEYDRTQQRDTLRLYGELITANLYRMERGQRRLEAENYYLPDCPVVQIPLEPLLSPQENAARYFKQYAKAKTAEQVLSRQMESGREELFYLESVWQELQQAESEQDFSDIRSELEAGGYLRSRGKKAPLRRSGPRQFRSSAGLPILVGRSNRQNDSLTTREADRSDLWFHAQKIHGSHVILRTGGAEPDERSIYEAAVLAAYYSQGRAGTRVDVDYTPVRFVKKPGGSRPGMVVYTTYRTLCVRPDESLVRQMQK